MPFDGGIMDSTDSGSEAYIVAGNRATSMSDFWLNFWVLTDCRRTNAESLNTEGTSST